MALSHGVSSRETPSECPSSQELYAMASFVLFESRDASNRTIEDLNLTWQTIARQFTLLRTRIHASEHGALTCATKTTINRVVYSSSRPSIKDGARLQLNIENDKVTAILHIADALIDKTSRGLLRREFAHRFAGLAPLSKQPIEAFSKYVSTKDRTHALRYWKNLLEEADEPTTMRSFPTVHQAPRLETIVTADDVLLSDILEFASIFDVRPHDLFYAAWAVVLARHSSETALGDVCFIVEGRDRTFFGHETVIGSLDEKFPLFLSVQGDDSVIDWIGRVRGIVTEASSYAFVGSEEILNLANIARPQTKLSINLEASESDAMADDDDHALVLNISLLQELELSLRHDSSVPNTNAQVLLNHFLTVLRQMVVHPLGLISEIRLNSPDEIKYILRTGKASLKPRQGLMHSLVEQQATSDPSAHAVQFESDEPLTYLTLNSEANRLARQLHGHRGSVLPVCMPTTPSLIVALLAILKAGAAYLILDPDAPAERNRLALETAGVSAVLTTKDLAGHNQDEIFFEDLWKASEENDISNPVSDQDPNSMAYVIFTSGSTGKPKAAALNHISAYNGLMAFPRAPGRRQLLFFNPVFSAAQRSIWAPLCAGGCLCLASKENMTVHLARTIAEMDIESIEMTSTTASLISPDMTPSLRRLALGGEMPTPSIVRTWSRHVELLSSYGLSECTQLNARRHLDNASQTKFLGRILDTTTTYILIPGTTRLAPLLIAGELCFGGAQIAQGYLNNTEETQKRFIRNPFGQGKLYRTGDLALRHADGTIELLGRIDFQVKINGQKVEPAEPNLIIQSHPDVAQSVVVAVTIGKKTVLVAMLVMRDGSDWAETSHELRSILGRKLPAYMMPSFWVTAPSLPLNANQKVDLRAVQKKVETLASCGQLLPPGHGRTSSEQSFNNTEKIIRDLWSEYLGVRESDIDLQHSFMELGGTSLEAVQIASQLHSRHALKIPVEDILLGNSLAEIAQLASTTPGNDNEAGLDVAPFALLPASVVVSDLGFQASNLDDVFPVTPFQGDVVVNTLMGSKDYIYKRAYSYRGHSIQSVKDALQALMLREPLLRTTFVVDGTSCYQVVQKRVDIPWEVAQDDLKAYIRKEPDLMQPGSLWWRATVLPGSVLVVTAHHALFDFWSNAFIAQDISCILTGSPLTERTPFKRYVQYCQQQDENELREFWQQYLSGVTPTKLGSHMAQENTTMAKITVDLKNVAQRLKVTPAILLYTAWAVVLASVCSQDDVVFVASLCSRDVPIPGILDMNGPALSTVPLRISIDRSSSLESTVAKVQAMLWKVSRHAPYGMRNILKSNNLPRDVMDTGVNFLIKPSRSPQDNGLRLLPEASVERNDSVKLQLSNDALGEVTLSSTLPIATSQELVQHVAQTLDSFGSSSSSHETTQTANLQTPAFQRQISSSSMMTSKTDASSEDDNSGTSTAASDDETCSSSGTEHDEEPDHMIKPTNTVPRYVFLHSEIQRMAVLHPSNIAVQESSGNSITYAGLMIKANQLAALLRDRGVRGESIIPVMLEKSINMIITMVGVMLSGGAFVTLDGKNPKERNDGIITDVGPEFVITDRRHRANFEGGDDKVIVIDDIEWNNLPVKRCSAPEVTPDTLVYIIYTSGSTGKPKGTLLTHRGLSAAIQAVVDSTKAQSSWRCLWALNYVFDGSYQSLFSVLAVGATLCVAPQDDIAGDLAGLINSMEITMTSITPSMASLLSPEEVPSLELLCLGGEPVSPFILDTWATKKSVYSNYGPTEATITVSGVEVTPTHNTRNVGAPYKSVTAMILDAETGEPIEFGEVGELCLAGPQLARGYLNLPKATAKVFRTLADGTRIYHTGDLARWLPDGEIELFGRKDDQIKLNGYRIELGEIENVIMQTNDFTLCVVLLATVMGRKQIVACCLGADQMVNGTDLLHPPENAPDWKTVSEKLTTLSSYMIPTVWLPVANMPMSISGKADKKALRAAVESMDKQELKKYMGEGETVDIATESERVLRSLWSTTLNAPPDTIFANSTFHGLGGDSLSAIKLTSTARQQGYQITVLEMLSNPSLREQALFLKKAQATTVETEAQAEIVEYKPPADIFERLSEVHVLERDVEDIYPCSPGQVEFLTQGDKREKFWQLFTVRRLPTAFDFDRWIYLTAKLTKNNPILRTFYFYLEAGDPTSAVNVVLRHPVLNLTYHTYRTEAERQQILDRDWETAFEVGKPAVRYMLLEHAEEQTRDLVIKLDHATYDGTLLYIFDDEFVALDHDQPYPTRTPFRKYVEYVSTTSKETQLRYWHRVMGDRTFDFLSTVQEPKISTAVNVPITSEVGIDSLAEACGVTVPIIFQTAYSLLLAHLSGSQDVVYDNLISGRNVPIDDAHLINGTCANFLPFRSTVSAETTIRSLLVDTQSAFWDGMDNGQVSLGEIYRSLGRERARAGARSMFCFQPFEPSSEKGDGGMRWLVMKLNKSKMHFNYAIQLEVRKTLTKGGYVVMFGYDERALGKDEAAGALKWFEQCLGHMVREPEGLVWEFA